MINYTQGNLLEAEVEAVVNTVGVMGKGIALMFKDRFPTNYKLYRAACKSGEVKVGELFITQSDELTGPRWIINFPTKEHWRNPTRIEWVESGLNVLHTFILDNKVKSIAIPPLGCGNGDLKAVKTGISNWPKGEGAGRRKLKIFSDKLLSDSLKRIQSSGLI